MTAPSARSRGEQGSGVPGAGAFNFLVGSWHVRHHMRRRRLAGCNEWDEFDGTSRCWSLFGGSANVDEVTIPGRGSSGMSVRLLDPASGTWSVYWASSRDGVLQLPPVVGRFAGDIGHFYADEVIGGNQVKVRFIWSDITALSARWEQAFSADDGQTWETNWIMEFTRIG
jgi:hypothetical protein